MKARQILLVCVALGWSLSVQADRDQEREFFREGWQAAQRGDQAGLVKAVSALPDYPLTPYLQFELFRQRTDQVPPTVMTQFLARYRDWSFHSQLKRTWLRSLGEREDFDRLLTHAGDHPDVVVRCHVARAKIRRGETEGLHTLVRDLWLAGRSQPKACNEAFGWWRRQGNPDAATAWRRFRLALDAGETGLASYLKRYMPPAERPWADRWLSMAQRPHSTFRQARQWRDIDYARLILAWGIERMTRRDWEGAEKHWRVLSRRFSWSDSQGASIEREIALFRAVALDEGAIAAIDALPDRKSVV